MQNVSLWVPESDLSNNSSVAVVDKRLASKLKWNLKKAWRCLSRKERYEIQFRFSNRCKSRTRPGIRQTACDGPVTTEAYLRHNQTPLWSICKCCFNDKILLVKAFHGCFSIFLETTRAGERTFKHRNHPLWRERVWSARLLSSLVRCYSAQFGWGLESYHQQCCRIISSSFRDCGNRAIGWQFRYQHDWACINYEDIIALSEKIFTGKFDINRKSNH